MKIDLPQNIVENILISAVLINETPETKHWKVYILNLKNEAITDIMISSKGYGFKNNREVKTSVLRHRIDNIDAQSFKAIEMIAEEVFCLTNEYWLSFYIDGNIYDRKFIFEPNTIHDDNLSRLPLMEWVGVLAK
ncbi:MAG: hypothetical protein K2Q03_01805 [Sphingobacteriaceae bacterium]|nr:hypothetical protein [Sphingobacteriaceae bacterium]